MADQDKELVTAKELADVLDVSVETVWKYTREEKIPFIKLGNRQYRYRIPEVLKALKGPSVREGKEGYEIDTQNGKMTYEDYLTLPEEPGYQFEVLDGMLVKEPSPNVSHQRISRRLQRMLEDYFWKVQPEGEVFNAPLDVTLSDYTVVQPDIFFVSAEQSEMTKEKRIDGPPNLVVEIISPSTVRKDRIRKLQIYQEAGVKHYWLVDPEERTLECFALRGGTYSLVVGGMDDDVVEHPDFEGLSVDLAKLWKRSGR